MESTAEGTSNGTLEAVDVSNILSKHRKDLDDFAETINIYESSATSLVESKIDELSHLCFQEIEDVLRQQPKPPTFQQRTHIFSSIQKINEDFKQKIQAAQEEYKSFLKSLNCKLDEVTLSMVASIISGEKGVKSVAAIYLEAFAVIQSQIKTLEQRPKELVQKMLEDDTAELMSTMTLLEETLLGYRRDMTQHFQTSRCMSDQLFRDLHKQAEATAKAKFNSDPSRLSSEFANGIKQMHKMFANMNELILSSEQNLVLQMTQKEPRIINFYNNMMMKTADNSDNAESEQNYSRSDWTEFLCQENKKMKEFALKNQYESAKKELLAQHNDQSATNNPAPLQSQFEVSEMSGISQRSERKSATYQEKSDKQSSDELIQEEVLRLKAEFVNELKTCPQEFQNQLVANFGENFKQFLAVKLKLPTARVQASATMLMNSLNVAIKKHLHIEVTSSRNSQLQETSEKAKEDDKMDCSPPPPNPEEHEKPRNKKNEKEVRLEETMERELQRNKKAEEAVLKEKALEEERQQRLRASTSTTSTDPVKLQSASTSRTHPSSAVKSSSTEKQPQILKTPQVSTAQPVPTKILQPIGIEFGFHFIRVGWVNPTSHRFEILKNAWDEEATPSVVALTKDGEVLVGSEAISRPQKGVKWKYSMTKLILEAERPDIKFKFDNKLQDTRKELFMALLLSKVKDGVEKKLNGKWETVVLTVPLWYTSVHRQATRDAATIAGFKHVHLVNETSAAAMSYADRSKDPSDTGMILVGVCNDSYFDVAVYDIKIKERQVRMESSCGDQHSSVLQHNSMFSTLKHLYSEGNNFVLVRREKSETERKIKDMVGPLKRHIRTCVCVNTNPGNKSWYGEIAPLLMRSCKDTALQGGDLLNIVEGAAFIASFLLQHAASSSPVQNQLLMQHIIQDKLTYNFDITYDTKNLKFVEYKSHLALTQDITVGGSIFYDTCVTVYENKAYVGALTFRKPTDKEVRLKGTVSNEGILKVELFTGTKQNEQPVDFTWSSYNMKAKDKQEMTECVQSLLGDSEERKLFDQTKKQLQELLDDLRPKLDTLQGIKKAIVTKSVEEAAAVVDHSTSTFVTMQNKIDQLVALRSKYSI